MDETPSHLTRRGFLGGMLGAAAAATVLGRRGVGVDDAWAGAPLTGSLDDVEHVVILMQENRSFDHYYGTMAGVRGFSDRTALQLPSGRNVLYQRDPQRADGGYLLPFHVDTRKVDGQDLGDLAHDWDTTHTATNCGAYNQWVLAKTEMTMGYFTNTDLPFHRALASTFTICDNYHCSIQGPTTPNRLYHWTGMIDPQGTQGGPATYNPPDYQPVYSWTTYPERLQAAGVSWQVYANDEVGDGSDGYVGDYGDNPLWLFQAYHDALASSDPAVHQLAERGGLIPAWLPDSGKGKDVDHVLARFVGDCAAGTLPQVSWVVAPYLYSEHPAARPVDGAAYTQVVLNAVWGNQELRDSTVVLLNFDENDGFYDHLPPPLAPPGTPDEYLPAIQPISDGIPPASGPLVPIGLGPRVPMTVVSPWSRGGWVNSQVFDHTSVLRFLEVWTGVHEPNISAWRRKICGDLTGCFDFTTSKTSIPVLPDTTTLRTKADQTQSKLPAPSTPATGQQVVPVQDPGTAPARALPYQANANFSVSTAVSSGVTITATNQRSVALQLAVYPNHQVPFTPQHLDVGPAGRALTTVAASPGTGAYDVFVYGPNGFLRQAAGTTLTTLSGVEVTVSIVGSAAHPRLHLVAANTGGSPAVVSVTDLHGAVTTYDVPAGGQRTADFDPVAADHGWYDMTASLTGHATFTRRFAGHLEDGRPSITG